MQQTAVFEAHDSYVLSLLWTRDRRTLVSSGMDNVIKIWSTADWSLGNTLTGHVHSVNSIGLTADETTLASGSSDQTVRLWSFPEGKQLQTLQDRKKGAHRQ